MTILNLKIFENRLPLNAQISVTTKKIIDSCMASLKGQDDYLLAKCITFCLKFILYPRDKRSSLKNSHYLLVSIFFEIFRTSRFFHRNDAVTRVWRFNILQ